VERSLASWPALYAVPSAGSAAWRGTVVAGGSLAAYVWVRFRRHYNIFILQLEFEPEA